MLESVHISFCGNHPDRSCGITHSDHRHRVDLTLCSAAGLKTVLAITGKMSKHTSPHQAAKEDVHPCFASEFSMLTLLLAVCTAVNRKDVYPTFASSSEEESWREPGPYPTVMDAVIAILMLDQVNLAGMAVGESTYVLTSSCDPVVTHEDREGGAYHVDMDGLNFATASDLGNRDSVSELGYCTVTVTPNGIDYWAKIKMAEDGWYIFRSET